MISEMQKKCANSERIFYQEVEADDPPVSSVRFTGFEAMSLNK